MKQRRGVGIRLMGRRRNARKYMYVVVGAANLIGSPHIVSKTRIVSSGYLSSLSSHMELQEDTGCVACAIAKLRVESIRINSELFMRARQSVAGRSPRGNRPDHHRHRGSRESIRYGEPT